MQKFVPTHVRKGETEEIQFLGIDLGKALWRTKSGSLYTCDAEDFHKRFQVL